MKVYNLTKMITRIFLVLFSISIISCESVTDLAPYNSVKEEVVFTTPSLIDVTVTGVYNAAQLGYYDGNYRGYPFGAAFVEQGDCRGEDVVNVGTFYQITYMATYNPTTANNVWMWNDSYRLINRCNIVVEGVRKAGEAGVITSTKALEYEAEARFLRALTYHELLIHFARPYNHTPDGSHQGVPYHETPYTTDASIEEGLKVSRNSVADVYAKILADLDFAETNLPAKAARTSNMKITRANKGAAVAVKTRIYMHTAQYDKVIAEASKFLTGGSLAGVYSLTTNPEDPFTSPYNNSESIFSLESSASNNPGVNAALASQYNRRQLVAISPIIWRNSSWLNDDKRRAAGTFVVTTSGGAKFTNKYKDGTNYTDPSPVIRYAEVLLNLAEAYARLNDIPNALTYLNMVRNRSLANVSTQAYTAGNFANNIALLSKILDEKRIEFVMEGRRWSDITRLQKDPYFPISGIPGKLANATPAGSLYTLGSPYSGALGVAAIPYDDFRFLWPIPQAEINTNPTLKEQQNPGY